MQDVFAGLCAGGSFRTKASKSAEKRTLGLSAPHPSSAGLDFFSSSAPPASTKAQVKYSRKRARPTSAPLQHGSLTSIGQGKPELNRQNRKPTNPAAKLPIQDSTTSHEANTTSDPQTDQVGHPQHSQEVAFFRRRMGIHVQGTDIADPMQTFADLPVAAAKAHIKTVLLHNIEESAWKEPTPIQMQSIPVMLAGRDVLALAPTGSGKTAAFVVPTVARLGAPSKDGLRAVFLAPTRELAGQIYREVVRLCKGKKFRVCLLSKSHTAAAEEGHPGAQDTLSHNDILVATPMRLVTAIRAGIVRLNLVQSVVLDEVDKLFDVDREGKSVDATFIAQVDEILSACSREGVQRAMFSATIPPRVMELAAGVLRDAVHITIGTANTGAATIDQRLVFVGREEGKLLAVRQLVQQGLRPPVLVFLQSKERAKELFHELVYDGINVDVIHADRTQDQRDRIIQKFRTGDIWVLICTDLMARGMDFKGVNMVINYDFPQSAVSYIHRVGRTGRAGRKGVAVTFFTEQDMDALRSIANIMKLSGCEVPDWMLSLKKLSSKDRRHREVAAVKRVSITTVAKYDVRKRKSRETMIEQSRKKHRKPPAVGNGAEP